MTVLTISWSGHDLQCSVWSSADAARQGSAAALEIANEYSSGSGPVYVFTAVESEQASASDRSLGIQMDSEFEAPTVLGHEWSGAYWVGCNSHLYRLLPNMIIGAEVELDSHFVSFRLLPHLDHLIVLAEAGLFSIDGEGRVAWRANLDLVTNTRWERGSVNVTQMDAPPVRVDLETGETRPV